MKFDTAAAHVHKLIQWAHAHGVALVVVAVTEGRVVSGDHIDCADITDVDNMLAKRISLAMKTASQEACGDLRGTDLRVAQVVLQPITKKRD